MIALIVYILCSFCQRYLSSHEFDDLPILDPEEPEQKAGFSSRYWTQKVP